MNNQTIITETSTCMSPGHLLHNNYNENFSNKLHSNSSELWFLLIVSALGLYLQYICNKSWYLYGIFNTVKYIKAHLSSITIDSVTNQHTILGLKRWTGRPFLDWSEWPDAIPFLEIMQPQRVSWLKLQWRKGPEKLWKTNTKWREKLLLQHLSVM